MANFKIKILGKNLDLTDEIKEMISNKADHVERFLPTLEDDDEVLFNVEVGKTTKQQKHGRVYRAEINLRYKRQRKRAVAVEESLENALDKVTSELERQIRKQKGKGMAQARNTAKKIKSWLRFGR